MAKDQEKRELFQAPAQIMKLETMADGGIRIQIDTSEMTDANELAKLFRLKKGAQGWFLFKDAKIDATDIPDEEPPMPESEAKSPSQRLRGVLFVFWKEMRDGKGDFEVFYRETLNKYIEAVKAKLPPRGE